MAEQGRLIMTKLSSEAQPPKCSDVRTTNEARFSLVSHPALLLYDFDQKFGSGAKHLTLETQHTVACLS